MDVLLRNTLSKPSNLNRVLFASDGVMKASEIRSKCADFRAQETIHSMTQRILTETGCLAK